jgi:hypothetical protein
LASDRDEIGAAPEFPFKQGQGMILDNLDTHCLASELCLWLAFGLALI